MALSAISYLIGHLCVCVFSSNISSESMLLFGAEHCLPSYWPSVCVCVFKISQVSLCYYLEKNAEHYIVCHLLSYWPERPLQRPSISNLIGRRSTAVRPYLLFLDNFFGFVNNFFLKIFCLFLNISIKIQTQIQIQKQSDWHADQSDHICYFLTIFLDLSTIFFSKYFVYFSTFQ